MIETAEAKKRNQFKPDSHPVIWSAYRDKTELGQFEAQTWAVARAAALTEFHDGIDVRKRTLGPDEHVWTVTKRGETEPMGVVVAVDPGRAVTQAVERFGVGIAVRLHRERS